MKKNVRIVAGIVAGVLLVGVLCVALSLYDTPINEIDGIYYKNVKFTSRTQIVDVSDDTAELIVPMQQNGKKVVSVNTGENNKITKITLSSSVEQVVSNSAQLKEFAVPSSNQFFKAIDGVLYSKDGKTLVKYPPAKSGTKYDVVANCESLADECFKQASKLITIVLPTTATITSIGQRAFYQCSRLMALTIGDNPCQSFGADCFGGCTDLKTIQIPATTTSLQQGFLGVGSSIQNVVVDEQNPNYHFQDGVLYDKNLTKVLCCLESFVGETFTLPETVVDVEAYAFRGNYKTLKIVNLNNVQVLQSLAFYYCNLDLVNLNNVHTIENDAIYQCLGLDYLVIPQGCKIAQRALCTLHCNIYLNDNKPLFQPKWQKELHERAKVYFKGEWQRIENVPTPNN